MLGLLRSDLDSDQIDVWPENWPVLRLFDAMRTQWRVGFSGAYGMDYNTLPVVMEMISIDDKQWAFEGLRVMEDEALKEMHKDK